MGAAQSQVANATNQSAKWRNSRQISSAHVHVQFRSFRFTTVGRAAFPEIRAPPHRVPVRGVVRHLW